MAEEQQNTNTIDNLDPPSQGTSSATEEAGLVAELRQALAAKTEEATGLNDKYLRLAAEFDNYKRLTQRDQRDQIRFGHESLLKELLPVVDNLERAIKASREGGSSDVLIQGVELTLKQLTGALTRFHVTPIEQHVVDEFQRGYLLHDRILRAAMVSISTGRADS